MVYFLTGMMDLGIGWLEHHETISKEVIRYIKILLCWQPNGLIIGRKGYCEFVGHCDGTFSHTPS